ncbi:DUF262 domain-containing protein [Mycobacterium marinum]|uniref:DUF262 domain-containing protein n=1 Tax=Mycobacterium marinum TaxID=1781 RepID=UPI00035883E6|nr:DUF262 domain-containing protein [Mycobacterium marinum]EPQ75821.1 hypothetical protein MMMB2_0481 [Mycobacterium marinum MB2]
MKKLDAGEYELGKIFCSDFEFSIPDYQRPYSWGTEQTLQLLDDLDSAIDRNPDEPYFLGSIVLVREGTRSAEVIDGQQRLTTLTILFATMRDLTTSHQLHGELSDFVREPGKIMAGTQSKPRLMLRPRDSNFFYDFVQREGQIKALTDKPESELANDAQRAIRDNARVLHERLSDWPEQKIQRLAAMVGTRVYLVVVSTPDLESAHRIFSVMNARGLDLSPADIFKARVIGAIDDTTRETYATKWEDCEQELGREGFSDLFLHLRTVIAKERARRELLLEFPEQVLNTYLDDRSTEFIDDVLIPYADAYEKLLNLSYPDDPKWQPVKGWIRRLRRLDTTDWRPPALWALKNYKSDPEYLDSFLRKLERLAASMLVQRRYGSLRATRYANLLKDLENDQGLNANAFVLSDDEKAKTRANLSGELYLLAVEARSYVLQRLDELLAHQPGVDYDHRIITVEHVLPQNPSNGSKWTQDFSAEEMNFWTHRLANLVLLNKRKNSSASRFDFSKKKERYFTGPSGVATFALTTQILSYDAWTAAVLAERQSELTSRMFEEWDLN